MKTIVEKLTERYLVILDSSDECFRLRSMMYTMLNHVDEWPIDKTNRWIGFIQGVLWTRGLIDINEERDFTRPLFHAYYESQGVDKPESVDVS